jgi:hypothetical protein
LGCGETGTLCDQGPSAMLSARSQLPNESRYRDLTALPCGAGRGPPGQIPARRPRARGRRPLPRSVEPGTRAVSPGSAGPVRARALGRAGWASPEARQDGHQAGPLPVRPPSRLRALWLPSAAKAAPEDRGDPRRRA